MSQSDHLEKKRLFKPIGTISFITSISRILGLVREIVRASLLGTSFYNDAFTLAFTLPNLFRRLTAEGVMVNAFIPVFCEVNQKEGRSRALVFSRHFFWLSTILLSGFSLIFILAAPWLVKYGFAPGFKEETLTLTVFLTRFMFAYIILISLAAVCQGMLNSFAVFWVSSATPVFLNISMIGCALFFAPRLENPTMGFAIGVLLGGAVQLGFQLPFTYRQGLRLFGSMVFNDPYLKQVRKLLLPTIFGVGIYQINIMISSLIATTLREGSLSSLNFSNRLLELVLGVFVISITTVILPKFSNLFLENSMDAIRSGLQNTFRIVVFVTLPVMAGTLIVAEEIVTLLFMRGRFDLNSMLMTTGALQFHVMGLIFIALNRVLLTGYQAAKYLKRTVQVSALVMIINLVVAFGASRYIGHLGIALANTISQAIQTGLLIFFIKEIAIQHLITSQLTRSVLKNVLVCVLMFLALYSAKQQLLLTSIPHLTRLGILILIGVISFGMSAYILRCREIAELIQLFTKRSESDRGG